MLEKHAYSLSILSFFNLEFYTPYIWLYISKIPAIPYIYTCKDLLTCEIYQQVFSTQLVSCSQQVEIKFLTTVHSNIDSMQEIYANVCYIYYGG